MLSAIDSMTQKLVFAQIVSSLIKILKIYEKSEYYKNRNLVQNILNLLLMIIKLGVEEKTASLH